MADPTAERESVVETLLEKIDDKYHVQDHSSSDSEVEVKPNSPAVKSKIYRLFGREEPLHKVLGGGKPADIFLWRQKKISAGVLGVATAIWMLFELCEYHLVTLLCHILIISFTILFIWSKACTFINNFVLLHTVPVIYEKYEVQFDSSGEKAEAEIKKRYAELSAKVLSNVHIKQLKEKKFT